MIHMHIAIVFHCPRDCLSSNENWLDVHCSMNTLTLIPPLGALDMSVVPFQMGLSPWLVLLCNELPASVPRLIAWAGICACVFICLMNILASILAFSMSTLVLISPYRCMT